MKPQSERTIASMEPAGRGPAGSRVRIGFDDGSSLELPHELAIGLGWHPGDRVSDREVERARRRGEAVEPGNTRSVSWSTRPGPGASSATVWNGPVTARRPSASPSTGARRAASWMTGASRKPGSPPA